MKKKKMMIIFLPTIFMVAIILLSMLPLNSLDVKGLMVISLVALFPLLFFVQGIMGAVNHVAYYLSMGIPLGVIILYLVWLESGILGAVPTLTYYSGLYLVFGAMGYGITKLVYRLKQRRKLESEKGE